MLPEIQTLYDMVLFAQKAMPEELDAKAIQLAAMGIDPGPLSGLVNSPSVKTQNALFDMLYSKPPQGPIEVSSSPPGQKQQEAKPKPGLTVEQLVSLMNMMPKPPEVQMPSYRGGSPSQVSMKMVDLPQPPQRMTLHDILRGALR